VRVSFSRTIAGTLGVVLMLVASPAASVSAGPAPATFGMIPPTNPAANCAPAWAKWDTTAGALDVIDYCRAQQGVGPVRLPSNFGRLTAPEQMFVMIDMERVNRGEPPVVGLTASLDRAAQQAAAAGTDPAIGFGDIWAGGPNSTVGADYSWMYDDGFASANVDCVAPDDPACWGHRDVILANDISATLVAGAGFEAGGSFGPSYALALAGYAPGSKLVFSWADELPYFRAPPGAEPL
jgi:hypothetical protein